ncbi:MAG TPA: sulfatase-like hydrolase/transferase [Polyangiaceae bacterium]|nr:sulfatase-like hydrolase/transferase [Polyangiaceae bacterium]
MTQRANSSLNFLGLLARLVCSAVLAAGCMVAADACVRTGWAYFSVARHLAASLALYAAVGALLGVLTSLLIGLEWNVVGRPLRAWPRLARWLRPAFYGLVAGAASISTALFTFSGEHIAQTRMKTVGPIVFIAGVGLAAACGAALVFFALASLEYRKKGRFWLIVALFATSGASVVWLDLTEYVALYPRIHTILELSAGLILGATFALELHAASKRYVHAEQLVRSIAAVFGAWLALVVFVPQIRVWIDGSLRHVWLDEAYVGRVLRRFQVGEAFFKDPLHWRGLYLSRIDRLRERYPIGEPKTAAEWLAPLQESPEFHAKLEAMRGPRRGYNVIVYYVDTLRDDVARDPSVMPNLARFASASLDFRAAYAAGSDTLRSLPALTGGNYDVSTTPPNDIVRVAARAHYDRVLMIAKSAHEFLGKLRPEFHFDRTLEIEDYPAEMQVWGYGAQQSTARPLVDRAVEFLGERRHTNKPFFLWLFNFDQHNWRELDAKYVEATANEHRVKIDDPDQLAWRYRAVAAAIDEQFGRLVAELERRKMLDDTLVLFVSDHGEALGREGFWVHSVFLWEHLIRVPLVLHVPGLPAQKIEQRVSLVDVAPTLARYMEAEPSTAGYQGEDLIGYLLPDRPARRLPLLLTAASKDVLVRVGVIDPARPWKAVLSLEAALPELYDLGAPDPDAENVSDAHPKVTLELLRQIARSPVFPHTKDDFDVRDTREQKAAQAGQAQVED